MSYMIAGPEPGCASPTEQEEFEATFADRFFDVRLHRPRPGQVMAKFTAAADFVAGRLKGDVIGLLRREGGAKSAIQLLRKLAGARERDAVRVLRAMATDLRTEPDGHVLDRPYPMVVEFFFYTERRFVPDVPHWETIDLVDARG